MPRRRCFAAVLFTFFFAIPAAAQGTQAPVPADERAQVPPLLQNAYIGLNGGLINYAFSPDQLEPGFRATDIRVHHAGFNVVLLGRQIYKGLSAQMSYMRPVRFLQYDGINGSTSSNTVWMVFAQFTAQQQVAVSPKVSVYGEGGLAITSRRGFVINDRPVVADAHYLGLTLGGGVQYHINNRWDVVGSFSVVPGRESVHQPTTIAATTGIRYNVRTLPPDRVKYGEPGVIFPANVVDIGYTTHSFGYGANKFVSRTVPIFWGGHMNVHSGGTVSYERNLFHTARLFALDMGGSFSIWESGITQERFKTLSAYPLLRFFFVRTAGADVYVSYSLAGPTFVSKQQLDGQDIGTNRFTFRDAIGVGLSMGRMRNIVFTFQLSHFSNGNLLTVNPGLAVPVTFRIGYAF